AQKEQIQFSSREQVVRRLLSTLTHGEGVLASISEIDAVGHRVVHGDISSQLGIRTADAQIEILTNPVAPGVQRISFTFNDNTGYTVMVIKSEKLDRPLVQLEKFWK